jgi:hypothetical protein
VTDSARLIALVDDGNIGELLKIVTPQQVRETWMRYQRRYELRGTLDVGHDAAQAR